MGCDNCKSKKALVSVTKIIEFTYRNSPFEMIAQESMCLDCDNRLIYETQNNVKIRQKKSENKKKKGFFK